MAKERQYMIWYVDDDSVKRLYRGLKYCAIKCVKHIVVKIMRLT